MSSAPPPPATDRPSLGRILSHHSGIALEPTISHHAHFDDAVSRPTSVAGAAAQDLPAHPAARAGAADRAPAPLVDIEHVPVDDDPRVWSPRKKYAVLILMATATIGPMISPSIYNPVLDEVKIGLNGTDTQIALSLSIYILIQGGVPLIWASIAEVYGRKHIYLLSFVLYTAGSAIGSRANDMSLLIGMRCLQAVGSAAVLSLGAGSLADMYEVEERGRRLGIYYGMPMLGPTLGPIIGGALGSAYGWRSTLYFLAVFGGVMTIAFLFFPETWRKERSRNYQKAIAKAIKRQLKDEDRRQRKLEKGLASTAHTPAPTNPGTPADTRPSSVAGVDIDLERGGGPPARRWWHRFHRPSAESDEPRPSLSDVNPIPMIISVSKVPTNAIILVCSGLIFAAQYTLTYTASVTLARAPYNYSPLIIGLVLLSFGMGNVAGSVIGGRYSDRVLRRLKAANGGVSTPEMRLRAAMPGMPLVVASYLVYAWTADRKTSIAGPVVALFFAGASLMFVYTNALANLVDSNPGRTGSAVSCNSFLRGASACVMSQVAMPIQNAIGEGGLYTIFAGILLFSCAGLVLVSIKGGKWREKERVRQEAKQIELERTLASHRASRGNSHYASRRTSQTALHEGLEEKPEKQ